ncbi:hypothetical protein [Winogradskya humida]|uniref:Uncharacterized protein n=1 Tax=Winogradskya humida TaxID=113566 RepID=A0ABQ3ZZN2_9ACTN|nr:hypothetical protein [Actinoplanes humidus]GIE23828.1 hypothetical protein Ahu01nite_069300 [Actinoplanes humidus]
MTLGGNRWNTLPERANLTADSVFAQLRPLLQGAVQATDDVDPHILDEQIRATLALGTRETSLPLSGYADAAPVTRELAEQARTIGETLAQWASRALAESLDAPVPLPGGPLAIRSHCDGHLLTPAAADLLLGSRGGPVGMQLYNEWLHQMVLLRDALLPFTNWAEVPLLVTPQGLRHVEAAREKFLAELMFRQVRHTSIVAFARTVVTGTSGPAGYGFDHDTGTALPAVVGGSVLTAPRYLLSWRPGSVTTGTATYVAEHADYYAAPRTPLQDLGTTLKDLAEDVPDAVLSARVVASPVVGGVRTAAIEVVRGAQTSRVDLGQALRGHRFAHRRPAAVAAPEIGAVLVVDGLVWTDGAEIGVPAHPDDLVRLALLGKLYPDNVVLR